MRPARTQLAALLGILGACALPPLDVQGGIPGGSGGPPSDAGSLAWFNTQYQYKKQLVIHHGQVGASIVNFPFVFSAVDPDLRAIGSGGHVSSQSGYDIIFTDGSETTKLDHEIEQYNPSTGEAEMWVRIPNLSPTSDTVLYVYFGDPAVSTSQENKIGVWDAHFKGVWHLAESGKGTAGEFKDSTANANNATGGNGVSAQTPTAAGAVIAKGQSFASASSQWIVDTATSGLPAVNGPQTIAFWYQTAAASSPILVNVQDTLSQVSADQLEFCGTSVLAVTTEAGCPATVVSASAPATTAWHQLVWTWDGTQSALYVDGALKANSNTPPQSAATNIVSFGTWCNNGAAGSTTLDGMLDEVEISDTPRPAGWIATLYNSQSSPSTFFSEGTLASHP